MTKQTTTDISADEWRFLSALSAQTRATVVSRAEAQMARKLCLLGYVGDVYDLSEGSCTARITPAGREKLARKEYVSRGPQERP